VLPLPGLALGNSVCVRRECMVGVQRAQEGSADPVICDGIVGGMEDSLRVLSVTPRYQPSGTRPHVRGALSRRSGYVAPR
jgi:hypothetical protein